MCNSLINVVVECDSSWKVEEETFIRYTSTLTTVFSIYRCETWTIGKEDK